VVPSRSSSSATSLVPLTLTINLLGINPHPRFCTGRKLCPRPGILVYFTLLRRFCVFLGSIRVAIPIGNHRLFKITRGAQAVDRYCWLANAEHLFRQSLPHGRRGLKPRPIATKNSVQVFIARDRAK